jgi:hypothetical protein
LWGFFVLFQRTIVEQLSSNCRALQLTQVNDNF